MSTALAILGSTDLATDTASPEFREDVGRGAAELARTFAESTAEIRILWDRITERCRDLDEMMKLGSDNPDYYRNFDIRLHYDGSTHHDYPGKPALDGIMKSMNVKVWELLVNRMGIKNLMSIQRRAEFDAQIKKGDVPPVTEANILGLVLGLADRAAEFATESARETLKLLTPSNADYKTNSGFKVGRRVILTWYVERCWEAKKFRPFYSKEPQMIAIDGTFHVLDEKGCIQGRRSPLVQAILDSPDGRGETDYFRFKCFKNHNLHVEFKRLDLVKKLNGLATGEYVLGQDIE